MDTSSSPELFLEDKIQLCHLKHLQRKFSEYNHDIEDENETLSHGITEEYFVNSIREILGTCDYDLAASDMFQEIDGCNRKNCRITWDQLLNHLIQNLNSRIKKNRLAPLLERHKIHLLIHNQREVTARVLTIDSSNFVYLFISKIGTVGVLDRQFTLQKRYKIDFEERNTAGFKKVIPVWINNAIYMQDCKKLVLAANNQTLYFYDISASVHMEEYRVYGLPHNPTCLDYWFDNEGDCGAYLVVGDESGGVQLYHFLQQTNILFKKSDKEGSVRVFFQDFKLLHKDYLSHKTLEEIHSETVVKVAFLGHNKSIISCSEDNNAPLVIRDTANRWLPYVFKAPKGIGCFDYSNKLQILVTGGKDCMLRFWNPYVVKQPTVALEGHKAWLMDVRIFEDRDIVFSYSKDGVLMAWDTKSYHCLQIIQIMFPCLRNEAKTFDLHSFNSLHMETWTRHSILVMCGNYVAELKLSKQNKVNYAKREAASVTKDSLSQPSQKLPLPSLPKNKDSCADDTSEMDERTSWETFEKYVFEKLAKTNVGGHLAYREMWKLVSAGSPYCALKVPEPLENIFPEEQNLRQLLHTTHGYMVRLPLQQLKTFKAKAAIGFPKDL